ncbi:hypothetical protein OESDEN_19925 [Oesophagostomum dentatum]|uniref:Uncharacterized protein n=1 Tax=Oesophagostomum dentatum TaxID=61180 RepID=A0A0B1SAY6_OESDE|nr:hypothetical protein OESDEN_19925 [Oesophagostomum dentatum]
MQMKNGGSVVLNIGIKPQHLQLPQAVEYNQHVRYTGPVPSLNCNTVRCAAGNKCVMAEPQNCVGCALTPRCVQQECNTGCTSPCFFTQRCVLVATNCCPTSACRAPATTRPPIFTIFPPFTLRPFPFAAEANK